MGNVHVQTDGVQPSQLWLLDFKRNAYSQCGEDGVISKILDILPETDKWCVEFGAWMANHLSNTWNLISSKGYSAVLIEGDPKKYEVLKKNVGSQAVIALNNFVGFGPEDNLDRLLEQTPIPCNFDFLSIDIDGNDYHVWNATTAFRPKVVCLEFNPTIPDEVEFVQPADRAVQQGSSLQSIANLGKKKGYELVSVLPWNAIFVRHEYFNLFLIGDNRPATLRQDRSLVTYLFSGFDGTIHLSGNRTLPWHGTAIDESKLQVLPIHLRTYPDNYTILQKWHRRLVHKLRSVFNRKVNIKDVNGISAH